MRDHDKDFTFPATQGISPSSISLLLGTYGCPLKYKYEKVDGIKLTKWIMQCGTLFDELCNSKGEHGLPGELMSYSDTQRIFDRYEAYHSHINYDTDWLQVPVWKEVGEPCKECHGAGVLPEHPDATPDGSCEIRCYTCDGDGGHRYLFGYVDRIEAEDCPNCDGCGFTYSNIVDCKFVDPTPCPACRTDGSIPTKIIDHKLSEKPWPVKQRKDGTFSSTKAKATQGQAYIACVEAMYGVVVPMEFHVVNMTTPEIQIITYRPQKKSLKGLDKIALDAIELRASGYFEPEPEEHKCEYCDHAARCAAYTAQNL